MITNLVLGKPPTIVTFSYPCLREEDPTQGWIALGTLTALEIVLGIDNIIFISVLVARLPEAQRTIARRLGLGLAMVARLGLSLIHI